MKDKKDIERKQSNIELKTKCNRKREKRIELETEKIQTDRPTQRKRTIKFVSCL